MNADERLISIFSPVALLMPAAVVAATVAHYRTGAHGDPGLALIAFGVLAGAVMLSVYLIALARRAHVRRRFAMLGTVPFLAVLCVFFVLVYKIAAP